MDQLERRACEVGRVSTREEKFNFFELFERSLTFWILRFSQLRLTCCRFPADQAALVRGLWTVVRGRALPGRCWKRRSGGLGGEGPVLLLPANGNILDRIGKGTSCKI